MVSGLGQEMQRKLWPSTPSAAEVPHTPCPLTLAKCSCVEDSVSWKPLMRCLGRFWSPSSTQSQATESAEANSVKSVVDALSSPTWLEHCLSFHPSYRPTILAPSNEAPTVVRSRKMRQKYLGRITNVLDFLHSEFPGSQVRPVVAVNG